MGVNTGEAALLKSIQHWLQGALTDELHHKGHSGQRLGRGMAFPWQGQKPAGTVASTATRGEACSLVATGVGPLARTSLPAKGTALMQTTGSVSPVAQSAAAPARALPLRAHTVLAASWASEPFVGARVGGKGGDRRCGVTKEGCAPEHSCGLPERG